MHHAARRRLEPVAPDTGLGERLSAYLKDARGAFSENTERAVRSDVEIFMG